MNLENYTSKTMVAVKSKITGRFRFCCEATEDGKKACMQIKKEANEKLGEEIYMLTFFSAYIKTPQMIW